MASRAFQLAWNGWSIPLPGNWHPHRVEGDARRGAMVLGDGGRVLLQVKWLRPRLPFFRADRWIERKARGYATGRPPAFFADKERRIDRGVILREVSFGRGDVRSVCYAASSSGMLVELATSGTATDRERSRFEKEFFPALVFSPADGETPWSLFSTHFQTPPGFQLRRHSLMLGDIALELRSVSGESLVVRQVYPGGLALSRQPIDRWLSRSPFPRTFRESERSLVHRGDKPQDGEVCRRVTRRSLRMPLHFLRRRTCFSAARVDPLRDRLYMAELELKEDSRAGLLDRVLDAMSAGYGAEART